MTILRPYLIAIMAIRRFGCGLIAALAALFWLAGTVHAQEGGKRVALIIGNDAYSISPLKNAVNDARAMDKALRDANFRTILVENARKADMESKIGEFLDLLGPDDIALFFYAGHGVQISNENFLVPVDFVPGNSLSGAKFSCMSVAQIFDELNRKRAKKNIVILDACRSNPVAEKYSLEAGLAQPQNPGKETYIAFSTGPGQLAADNPDGRNSWFTEALADYIGQPTLTVELNEVLNKVKKRVSDATEGKQTPWAISSLTSGFYFHAPLNQDPENDPTLTEKWLDDARRREQREDWAEAITLIDQILKKKPGGTLEEAAKNKLPYLIARRDAQVRFDAGDYAGSATLYELAAKLDPFSIDAAFQSVNSYLLNDRVPEAIAGLKAIRIRGTSLSSKRANALLQELSAVSPEAGQELKAGIPQPPPIEEVFSGAHFGVPDWDAGARRLQTAPVDLSKWTRELNMAPSAPILVAQPAAIPGAQPAAAQNAGLTIGSSMFHVEMLPAAGTRDLKIRKIGAVPGGSELPIALEQEFGFVEFKGAFKETQGDTPIVYDGRQVSPQVPATVRVPVGKYEIRTVQDGKILYREDVEVTSLARREITVKRQ